MREDKAIEDADDELKEIIEERIMDQPAVLERLAQETVARVNAQRPPPQGNGQQSQPVPAVGPSGFPQPGEPPTPAVLGSPEDIRQQQGGYFLPGLSP